MHVLEPALVSVWRQGFGHGSGYERIDANTRFDMAGGDAGDARDAGEVVAHLFDLEPGHAAVRLDDTPRSLAARIAGFAPRGTRTVAFSNAPTDQGPLFCVGGVGQYRPLASSLEGRLSTTALFLSPEVVSAASLGALPAASVPALAAGYAEAVIAIQPEGPFRLLGFSMGGVIAYELAWQLSDAGHDVTALVLLDAPLPRGFARDNKRWALAKAMKVARHPRRALRRVAARLPRPRERAPKAERASSSRWPDVERLAELRFHAYGAALDAYDAQLVREHRRLRAPVTFVRASDEPRGDGVRVDPVGGWGEVVDGAVERLVLTSDHLGLLRPPAVEQLARLLVERG